MGLDFLRQPSLASIVDRQYSDLQGQRSSDYIRDYKGDSLHKDWLRDVPFDINDEDTRKTYWEHYYATSDKSPKDITETLIADVQLRLAETSNPMERMFVLQDENAIASDEVNDFFLPQLTEYQEFFSTDFAHKGAISHERALDEALTGVFKPGAILDALVPEAVHIKDTLTIERLDKLNVAKVINGRLTVPDAEGKPIVGSNLALEASENTPDAAEQYATAVNSYSTIRRHIKPLLEMARNVTQEGKRQADEMLFTAIPTLSQDDVAPVIGNMLDYSDTDTATITRKGMKDFLDNSPLIDKTRAASKITGQLITTLYKRSNL